MKLALLISPEVRGAYFADVLDVARRELALCTGVSDCEVHHIGDMAFLHCNWSGDTLRPLARLSFVYGIFAREGDALQPLAVDPEWRLHRDLIFGAKFKGKTNERLTQLLLNIGIARIGKAAEQIKLLDPMAGRGTTLLWAMGYGMQGSGMDLDVSAVPDVTRNVTKWAKLTRSKHKIETGFAGKKNKKGTGAFFDFKSGGASLRLVQGDAETASQVFRNRRFDLIVSDLPYGVQHMAGGARNPLETLARCAEIWPDCLADGGAVVLAFNRNNPRRKALETVFEQAGWQVADPGVAHRMSESIVRDVLIASR